MSAHPVMACPETPATATPLVKLEGVTRYFPIKRGVFQRTVGFVRAVDGVNLTIPAGKTLALVGESGCGKSTLGLTLLQLHKPTAGRIYYEGRDITGLDDNEMQPYRKRMQIIFQDPYSSLNPRLTIGDTLMEGMQVHRIGASAAERRDRLRELLPQVGMSPDVLERYPHEFSGGQRQRLSIARALSVEPALIVCDEAVSSLDVSVQAQILNLLKDLQARRGLTYLFITHNLAVVEYLADEVAVMYLGRVVEQAPAETLFQAPRHPYSQALLRSAPRVDEAGTRIPDPLPGDVPSPANPPSGCHFHPRCPYCFDRCPKEAPLLYPTGAAQVSRCFLQDPVSGKDAVQSAASKVMDPIRTIFDAS